MSTNGNGNGTFQKFRTGLIGALALAGVVGAVNSYRDIGVLQERVASNISSIEQIWKAIAEKTVSRYTREDAMADKTEANHRMDGIDDRLRQLEKRR